MKEALKNVFVDDMLSTKFAAHAYRVFTRLKSLLGILDVDGVLLEDLAHLKAQHVGRGAKPAYFKVMPDTYIGQIHKLVLNSQNQV